MQAVLVIAHRQPEQIIALAKELVPTFKVFIHFDTKMTVTPSQLEELDKLGVYHFSKIDVRWGGWSIGQVAVELFKVALKDPQITHFHLISGQDWPTKKPAEIARFFENSSKIYLSYFQANKVSKTGEKVIWWAKYYYPYDKLNRRTTFGKIYHRLNIMAQMILRVNKLKKLGYAEDQIYSGANWADLPRDVAEFVIKDFDSNKRLRQLLSTSAFADEFWLPTVLCNIPRYYQRIDQNIHRYIILEKRHGSRPAILDETDLKPIQAGDYFWARKVVFGISDKLVKGLEN